MKKWYYFVVVGIVATLMSGCIDGGHGPGPSPPWESARLVIILSGSGQSQSVEFVQDKTILPNSLQSQFQDLSDARIDIPHFPRHFQKLTSIESLSLLVSYYNLYSDTSYYREDYKSYSYGLGTIKNKGSQDIYILTATPKEALRLQRVFANLPAGNDLWSSNWLWPPADEKEQQYIGKRGFSGKLLGNFMEQEEREKKKAEVKAGLVQAEESAHPSPGPQYFRDRLSWLIEKEEEIALVEAELEKLRDSLARNPDLVTAIVTKYREAHRPLRDENGQPYASGAALPLEFPGLTVVAPGETKPIVSPEIAPQEYAGYWTFPL